jgi:hypothetical protein
MPNVKEVVLFAGIDASYKTAFDAAAAAAAILTNIRQVAAVAVTLAIVKVETTADVDDGTVYSAALLVSAGAA